MLVTATILKRQKRTKHTPRRQLPRGVGARPGEIQDRRETGQVIGKCGHLGCRSTALMSLPVAFREATA